MPFVHSPLPNLFLKSPFQYPLLTSTFISAIHFHSLAAFPKFQNFFHYQKHISLPNSQTFAYCHFTTRLLVYPSLMLLFSTYFHVLCLCPFLTTHLVRPLLCPFGHALYIFLLCISPLRSFLVSFCAGPFICPFSQIPF